MRPTTPVDQVVANLRHIRSAALVAVAALRRQNCELDEDVARLLQRSVCDSLHEVLEQLEKRQAVRPLAAARMHGV